MGQFACQSCGNMLGENAKFCPRCGGAVAWAPPSAIDPRSTPQQGSYPPQPYQQPYPQQQPYQQQQPYPQQQPYQQQPYYQQPYNQQGYGAAPGYAGVWPADKGTRVLGYLIDILPAIVVSLILGFIPIIGPLFLSPLFLLAYWLLRDINGASLGKMAMGTMVVSKDGQQATQGSRVMRNLPLAIPNMLMLIPIIGWIAAVPVALIVILVELISLLSTGERVGDKLANTMVIKVK